MGFGCSIEEKYKRKLIKRNVLRNIKNNYNFVILNHFFFVDFNTVNKHSLMDTVSGVKIYW